jgi:hypothetical protein
MIRHAQGVGGDGERGVGAAAGGEEGGVDHPQVVEVMGAVVAVEHARGRVVAEAAGAADVGELR